MSHLAKQFTAMAEEPLDGALDRFTWRAATLACATAAEFESDQDANRKFRTRCNVRHILELAESVPAAHRSPAVDDVLRHIAQIADATLVDNTDDGQVVIR